MQRTAIRIHGKDIMVPSVQACGCTIILTGRFLKTASIFDEELIEQCARPDPAVLVNELRRGPLHADLFTFGRSFYDSELDLSFRREPDNIAAAPTASFENWWKTLGESTRRNVRLAAKRGVVVHPVEFDEALAIGIKRIYDETPVRQGRRFWHYQKELSKVAAENTTYLSRSQFIGAYFDDELIGFIKYIRVDQAALLSQILAMEKHRDKKPVNALVKCAVELCESQGLRTLIYGKFDYGAGTDNTLTEFKRRNGFIEKKFPSYVVPLSVKGEVGVRAGMHRGVRAVLPAPVMSVLRSARAKVASVLTTLEVQDSP